MFSMNGDSVSECVQRHAFKELKTVIMQLVFIFISEYVIACTL